MTEEEYQKTLKRIEGLMDAKWGSPEFEELWVLTRRVSAYEDEHCGNINT